MNPLLALALVLGPTPAFPDLLLKDAVVTRTRVAPALCGIVHWWGAVDFTHDGRTYRGYVSCAEAADVPVVGARCAAKLLYTRISTAIPDLNEALATSATRESKDAPLMGYIVASMTCDPPVQG